jgi:catechol 2,3-dioxygenase-like lactoylglutathione lyase family enzyme
MDLQCLDHVHFSVPDLQRAKRIFGPLLNGRLPEAHFVDDYGGPEVNAWGAWHTSGGDFIQVIDPEKPAFGGAPIPTHGILSVSFRVADIDRGIREATAAGLTVRSRIGSEDIGLGKNVVQAQLLPEPVSGLPFELIEHQLPGEYISLTDAAVESVELALAPGVELDASARALERIFGSAFEGEAIDRERGVRSRLHRSLGIRLTTPLAPSRRGVSGLQAIEFRCTDIARGTLQAEEAGLVVARRIESTGERAVEFAPWAQIAVRLVERAH